MSSLRSAVLALLVCAASVHAVYNIGSHSHFTKRASEGGIFVGGRLQERQIGYLFQV